MEPQVAILIALLALIGVLIAAIVQARSVNATLKENGRIETERWAREDLRRHEEARREAYPAFLAVVDEGVLGLSNHLRAGRHPSEPFAGPHWDERLRESLAVIEFVGSPTTIELAQLLYRAVQRLKVGAAGVLATAFASATEGELGNEVDSVDAEAEYRVEVDDESAATGMGVPDVDPAEEAEQHPMSLGEFMDFVDVLPYPLGGDVAPQDMYFGDPLIQVSMARTELRVRRHDFLNAARADLGMGQIPYPEDSREHGPDDVPEELLEDDGPAEVAGRG